MGENLSMGRLLHNRHFVILWLGQTVSAIGTPFTMLAMAWFVYTLTGSKAATGGILLAEAIPLVLFRLFAGVLVDRWDRRTTMLVTDLIRTAALLTPVFLYASGTLQLWHLFIVNIILGIAEAFFQPASFAFLPSLVRKEELLNANSLLNTSIHGSALLGPILAGIFISSFGAPNALLVDAITFAVSTLTLFLLPSRPIPRESRVHLFRELVEGFAFYRENRGLIWLLGLAATSNFGGGMILALFVPFCVELLHVSADGVGIVQSSAGIGMLIGSLVGPLLAPFSKKSVMLGAHAFSGVSILALFFANTLWYAVGFVGGFGLGVAIWNTFSGIIYQQRVPDSLRGRVQSVRLLVAQGSIPLGMAVSATVAEWIGLRGVLVLIGIAILFSALIAWFASSLQFLEEKGQKAAVEINAPNE